MRRFYNDKLTEAGGIVIVSGREAHHMKNVLRLKPGDEIIFTDGRGFDYYSEIILFDGKNIEINVKKKILNSNESSVDLILGISMIKGKKIDELIKPLTEIGVKGIYPFISRYSVVDIDNKKKKNKVERWVEISKEALKQCERGLLPEIAPVSDFKTILNNTDDFDLKIMFYERSDTKIETIYKSYEDVKKVLVLTGPEGGFSDDEVLLAKKNDFKILSLGPRILRAETAILSSAVLCQHLFGDIK